MYFSYFCDLKNDMFMDEIKYKDRYRIPSARAWWHQYNGGTYFVTICTKDREHFFGEIENNVMTLSEIGECLKEQILATPKKRPDMNMDIPTFAIMPNHVHLIAVIGGNVYNTPVDYLDGESEVRRIQSEVRRIQSEVRRIQCEVRRIQCVSTTENTFSPQSKNLASIIRGIKTVTTSFALNKGLSFGWQSRFHDHIVRNIDELNKIANYIENNVTNWEDDEFYNRK